MDIQRGSNPYVEYVIFQANDYFLQYSPVCRCMRFVECLIVASVDLVLQWPPNGAGY